MLVRFLHSNLLTTELKMAENKGEIIGNEEKMLTLILMEDETHKMTGNGGFWVENGFGNGRREKGPKWEKEKVGIWMVTPILLYPLLISHFLFHFCPGFLAPFCTKLSGLILFNL
jgi:hypothetical protein